MPNTHDGVAQSPTLANMYRTIWRTTSRDQGLLIVLSLAVAILASAPLKFQQLVVNSMVYTSDLTKHAWLCAGFFTAILLGALLKFALNYKRSVLGERAIRILRERLYGNYVVDTSTSAQDLPTRGTFVTMLNSEAEAVGSFAGIAISAPLMLIGTLLSIIGFIMISQPLLGIVAIAVIAPQAIVVTAIQTRINKRVGERVQAMRDACDRLSGSDLKMTEAEIIDDFAEIFSVRCRIYFLKQFVKLILRSMSAIGAVGFLFMGGWLVMEGRTDVGTVVASLAGLTKIEGPWRELIGFFRAASTVRVQYGMLVKAEPPAVVSVRHE